jgi:hypothetical protein
MNRRLSVSALGCALTLASAAAAQVDPPQPAPPAAPATPAPATAPTAAGGAAATGAPADGAAAAGSAAPATPPASQPPPEATDTVEDVPGPTGSTGQQQPVERTELACLASKDGCKVDDLKTPTVPAFAIIGISPSDVETPRSPKALALALYNAYNGGRVAQDVALDVAPYWLFAHPLLTYDEYVNASPLEQLAQNASISVATAPSPDDLSTDMGLGLRTHLLFASASESDKADIKKAEAELDKLQQRAEFDELMTSLDCKNNVDKPACKDLAKLIAQLGPVDDALLSKAGKTLQDTLTSRSGFLFGLAGAVSSRSATDKFAPKDFQKAAGWLNFGYRFDWLDLMGLVRFTDVDAPKTLQYIDLGGKVGVFKPSWDLHAEAVYRFVSGKDAPVENSGRIAGVFEFKITDEVFASTTFGKAADEWGKAGTLFTLFGLNFQAGKRRMTGP